MSELGVPINAWQLRGVNSVTVKVNTTFRVPLRLADAFYATSAVRSVSRSQVVLAEAVRRRSDDAVVAVRVFCLFVVVVVGGGRFSCFSSAEGEIGAEKKKLTLSLPPPFFFSFFEKKIIKKQFSEVTCATVDNDFKVVRIPEEVRPALERGAARFAAGSEQK